MKVAIAGAGKLGHKIADALIGGDHDVTIIDKNEEKLQKLSSQLDVMTVTANAKQATTLQELHIGSYDFLIACTNDDEKNIVIASFAKIWDAAMLSPGSETLSTCVRSTLSEKR